MHLGRFVGATFEELAVLVLVTEGDDTAFSAEREARESGVEWFDQSEVEKTSDDSVVAEGEMEPEWSITVA